MAADLRHVVAATRLLLVQTGQSVGDPVVKRGLWVSAHIAYARCFVSDTPIRLDPAMFDEAGEGRPTAHRFILHTVKQHLARTADPLSAIRIGVQLDDQGQPIGLGNLPGPNATQSRDIQHLNWLAAEALKRVELAENGLTDRLKQKLKAMPLNELQALPKMA